MYWPQQQQASLLTPLSAQENIRLLVENNPSLGNPNLQTIELLNDEVYEMKNKRKEVAKKKRRRRRYGKQIKISY